MGRVTEDIAEVAAGDKGGSSGRDVVGGNMVGIVVRSVM